MKCRVQNSECRVDFVILRERSESKDLNKVQSAECRVDFVIRRGRPPGVLRGAKYRTYGGGMAPAYLFTMKAALCTCILTCKIKCGIMIA